MIRLGLSGNRYSGKRKVCEAFEKIGVPVFDADVVLKFAMIYNYDILADVRKYIGSDIFIGDSININKLDKKTFDTVLDLFENDLFKAYKRFEDKFDHSIYTVFKSSILFERGWESKMDITANVFAPQTDRIKRCKDSTGKGLLIINELAKSEMDVYVKNEKSDYVIHNYNDDHLSNPSIHVKGSVRKQVDTIDQTIIDEFLYKETTRGIFRIS